ncbi:MAG: PilZ domain-containing protein [Acidobacteriia bacterium]|nr:PilZ domain-containing protein [Terriglobia bacterium]
MANRETIPNVLVGVAQYNPGGDGGDPSQPSNADYLRALKRAQEKPASAGTALPSPAAPQQTPYPHLDRRRNPRYKCEGSAEFRTEGSDIRTWATITDLSRSGCYVEMQATSPVDTPVNMVIEVKGIRAQVKGTVRISYPFLGMGIGFTEISAHDRAQLDEILLRLASSLSAPVHPPDPKPATPVALDLSTVNAAATLDAVARFFQAHATLTRDQFTELIQRDGSKPRP